MRETMILSLASPQSMTRASLDPIERQSEKVTRVKAKDEDE